MILKVVDNLFLAWMSMLRNICSNLIEFQAIRHRSPFEMIGAIWWQSLYPQVRSLLQGISNKFRIVTRQNYEFQLIRVGRLENNLFSLTWHERALLLKFLIDHHRLSLHQRRTISKRTFTRLVADMTICLLHCLNLIKSLLIRFVFLRHWHLLNLKKTHEVSLEGAINV